MYKHTPTVSGSTYIRCIYSTIQSQLQPPFVGRIKLGRRLKKSWEEQEWGALNLSIQVSSLSAPRTVLLLPSGTLRAMLVSQSALWLP